MPDSITREQALEQVLIMAQNALSDDIKQECMRRVEELASGLDEDTVARIKAKVKVNLQ